MVARQTDFFHYLHGAFSRTEGQAWIRRAHILSEALVAALFLACGHALSVVLCTVSLERGFCDCSETVCHGVLGMPCPLVHNPPGNIWVSMSPDSSEDLVLSVMW